MNAPRPRRRLGMQPSAIQCPGWRGRGAVAAPRETPPPLFQSLLRSSRPLSWSHSLSVSFVSESDDGLIWIWESVVQWSAQWHFEATGAWRLKPSKYLLYSSQRGVCSTNTHPALTSQNTTYGNEALSVELKRLEEADRCGWRGPRRPLEGDLWHNDRGLHHGYIRAPLPLLVLAADDGTVSWTGRKKLTHRLAPPDAAATGPLLGVICQDWWEDSSPPCRSQNPPNLSHMAAEKNLILSSLGTPMWIKSG